MKYKGAVLNYKGSPTLFARKEDGTLTDGMVISDTDDIYAMMGEKRVSCVFVQFRDGTVPKRIDEFWYDENWAENIFFTIVDLKFVIIVNSDQSHLTADEIIDGGHLPHVLNGLFDDKEIYDISPDSLSVFGESMDEIKKTTLIEILQAIRDNAEKNKKE